jgi:trans-aconitate methyltransferase
MELPVAINLIEKGVGRNDPPQTWADLGAGEGLFTKALASLLKTGTIYTVDKNERSLSQIPDKWNEVEIKKRKLDFSKPDFDFNLLDGIIMANSLHFIPDQINLLARLKKHLRSGGGIILVEYDMTTSSQWVPYPVGYKSLTKLAEASGFKSIVRLGEAPSIYHRTTTIYSALLR